MSTQPDGTAAVLAENQFNDPPGEGRQFFMATVAVTYDGDEESDTFSDGDLEAVGPGGIGYTTFENSCGVIPDDLPRSEVFTGGTLQGNVCWEVLSSDATDLVMYYDPLTFGDVERIYWDLTP